MVAQGTQKPMSSKPDSKYDGSMPDFVFSIVSSLNAPLFIGPLVLNRWLLLVLASVAAGLLTQRLIFPRDQAATDRALTVWLTGIVAWRLFPAVVNWHLVVSDPALIPVLPGGRTAILAGIAAGLLAATLAILRTARGAGKAGTGRASQAGRIGQGGRSGRGQPDSPERGTARPLQRRHTAAALGRNVALTLACALPLALLLASLPVPRWPGEAAGAAPRPSYTTATASASMPTPWCSAPVGTTVRTGRWSPNMRA